MNDLHRMLKEHKNDQEWLEHELELAEQRLDEIRSRYNISERAEIAFDVAKDNVVDAALALQEFRERNKEV